MHNTAFIWIAFGVSGLPPGMLKYMQRGTIGRGNMGCVYPGLRNGTRVAIKAIPMDRLIGDEVAKSVCDELVPRMLQALHPLSSDLPRLNIIALGGVC